ncbi:hypothetical protein WJX74_009138 [Apatococcus lobatus]|uniref:CNNM transmembrane domain-containing protein n=2 Tax=Apatococcus TaxID=904362 RepID=A0AAW1SN86_9CHLO
MADDHVHGASLVIYLLISVGLVIIGGVMSGLTLGLMSMDTVELEVLRRSGTPKQRKQAARIQPVVQRPHWTLVTLLLCNAAALEALPIFLDRIVDPVIAIVLSVTAVLLFGEILPQALCKSYALTIGSHTAWLVRFLMWACGIISWPISKLLDWLLGSEHTALFRRAQLKALVDMHSLDAGMGGQLTTTEIGIIGGALELTNKTALQRMVPLEKVVMVAEDAVLTKESVRDLMRSGHSRLPVHEPGNRKNLKGVILIKELALHDLSEGIPVTTLHVRTLPFVRADTAMYDVFKVFQSGHSHMMVLTQPQLACDTSETSTDDTPSTVSQQTTAECSSVTSPHIEVEVIEPGAEPKPPSLEQITATQPSFTGLPAPQLQEVVASASEAAQAGEPIGIVTIEDILEELLQQDIYDETDNMLRAIRSSKKDRNFVVDPSSSSPGKTASGQLQHKSPVLTIDSGLHAKDLTKET